MIRGKDMLKPTYQFAKQTSVASPDGNGQGRRSPLAELVSAHLKTKGMRQVDFCRQTGFDQGLLSKILSSVVQTLNVESALKLAEGLQISPSAIFEVIGKKDVDEMLRRFYCNSNQVM
jgi:transcriptional regulator with XRE-family HTH domain